MCEQGDKQAGQLGVLGGSSFPSVKVITAHVGQPFGISKGFSQCLALQLFQVTMHGGDIGGVGMRGTVPL